MRLKLYTWGCGHIRRNYATYLERGDITLSNQEATRIFELLEIGRDAAALDAWAVEHGCNVPQVQRELRDKSGARQWSLFLTFGDERKQFTASLPADARLAAANALRSQEPK